MEETEAANSGETTKHLWEESWDDDDTSDDFSQQLKYVLSWGEKGHYFIPPPGRPLVAKRNLHKPSPLKPLKPNYLSVDFD